MIRKVETEAECRRGRTEAPRLIYTVGFHADPFLPDSNGQKEKISSFEGNGKNRVALRFFYRIEEYSSFIARYVPSFILIVRVE